MEPHLRLRKFRLEQSSNSELGTPRKTPIGSRDYYIVNCADLIQPLFPPLSFLQPDYGLPEKFVDYGGLRIGTNLNGTKQSLLRNMSHCKCIRLSREVIIESYFVQEYANLAITLITLI